MLYKCILAVCCIPIYAFKAIVMSIYKNLVYVKDTIYYSSDCTLKIV